MITLADLERTGACDGAKEAFEERFPCGASRRELLLALAEHERGLNWFMWLTECTTEFEDIAGTFAVANKPILEAFMSSVEPAYEAREVAIKRSSSELEHEAAFDAYFTHYDQALAVRLLAHREAMRHIAESLPEVEVTA